MTTYAQIIQQKIRTIADLRPQIAQWRFKGEPIVFTNGCFDLLHAGHLATLTAAADLGHLVVGLNSDASIKRLKGNSRPLQTQYTRSLVLAALHCTSAVVLFEEDTPYELICQLQPDILLKGGDYIAEQVVGYDVVTARGGRVVIAPYQAGFSTTALVKQAQQSEG